MISVTAAYGALEGRRFGVLQWISYALGEHLENRFASIVDPGARRVLERLYF